MRSAAGIPEPLRPARGPCPRRVGYPSSPVRTHPLIATSGCNWASTIGETVSIFKVGLRKERDKAGAEQDLVRRNRSSIPRCGGIVRPW